jgi:hypothetical protein
VTIETDLIGVWKLLTLETEFQDGSPRRPVYGENPSGYIIFTVQGRMMTVIEGEGRRSAKTDEERATLFRTMSAYTGMYRLEGDKWITTVDVAWTPDRRGTNQVRFYRLDGNRLEVTSAWAPDVNIPGAPITRNIMTWTRA